MATSMDEAVHSDAPEDHVSSLQASSISDHLGQMTLETTAEAMIDRVAGTDAHFKHQQREEPDLTQEEKSKIARDILQKNPAIFLSRFGKYLTLEDLSNFDHLRGQYDIDFHVKEIRKMLDSRKNKTVIHNRRYQAMKQLVSNSDYFSEEEMKSRDPLLYDQMIGQYLSEEEIETRAKAEHDKSDLRFSSILLNFMENKQQNELFDRQKDKEDGQFEEEEESEEEEVMEGDWDSVQDNPNQEWKPSEEEKLMMREEFLHVMQERFMNGEDEHFSYSDVDNNVEYDSLDIREQDEEERYFDRESDEEIADDIAE